jgi:DNA-binding response OmpR family regulator
VCTISDEIGHGRILAAHSAVVNGEKRRALVVDDDEPIRTMLGKILQREQFSVDTARDGEEAITLLNADGYKLVLLDLMMPKVDGYAVLRYMEQHHSDLLPCTIIASAVPESDILRNFQLPVYRIHAKPFDMQQLLADVRACAEAAERRSEGQA